MTDPYDRTVHGYTPAGEQIVRYDRAGKWYVEPKDGKRRAVKLTEAVQLAVAGRALLGKAGGLAFGAKVRRARG